MSGESLLAIIAYGLLCHGVILLNDGLLWDGWLVDAWQRKRNWQVMHRFYAEVGLAPLYYLHKLLSKVPARIFVYRLIAFASTLASAVAIYLLGIHSGMLGEFNSLLLALLYLSYTGYHMNVDTVVGVQYTLPTAVFYWAAYLAAVAADHAGVAGAVLRIVSLLLFFAAFNANSLLVYYFGFLALKLLTGWDATEEKLLHQIAGHLEYLVLPFAYWLLKNRLTPRHGHYAHYNRIQLHPGMVAVKLFDAIRFGFEAPITAPIRSALDHYYLWLPLLASAAAFWASAGSFPAPLLPASITGGLLGAGAVLFMLAALPYALVGQSFFPEGWGTKHHMLFHLPVSMILLAAVSWLPAVPALLLIAFLLACNAIYLNWVYLHHLAVSVKNRSWLHGLAKSEKARHTAIFLVSDLHSIRGDRVNPEQEHRPAYLFHMLGWLWGDSTRCGFPVDASLNRRLSDEEVSREIVNSTFDYDMQEVNTRGPQSKLVIREGVARSPLKVALLYLRHRYLPGGNLPRLLESVTDLKLIEL